MKRLLQVLIVALLVGVFAFAAGVDGKWNFSFETPIGVRESVWTFRTNGSELIGKADGTEEEVKGTFENGHLSLAYEYFSEEAGFKSELSIEGKLDGDKITGEWRFSEYSGPFTASRAQ